MNKTTSIVILVVLVALVIYIGYTFAIKSNILPNQQATDTKDRVNLPSGCKDEPEGQPLITSLSAYSGSVGSKIEINGCNFSGFEGDKIVWIENNKGEKGLLGDEAESTSKLIKTTLKSPLCQKDTSYSGLPCDTWLTLIPGTYKIYVMPWGKKSNTVDFIVE